MASITKKRTTKKRTAPKTATARPSAGGGAANLTPRAPAELHRKRPVQPPRTKSETILALLRREKGADIAELVAATGWQAHSVRGFLSGTVRKRMGLDLISERTEAGRLYRIERVDGGGA